jgi:aminoglycoside phosphotransferase (APT) family kinase protein
MTEQTTPHETIEREKQIVLELTGLHDSNQVILNDSGWDSRVYSPNGSKYFIKFPRSEKIQRRYSYQLAALRLAAGLQADVALPRLLWVHPDNNYFGYEGVAGAPLSQVLPKLDDATKRTIGGVLGSFLAHFHRLELADARDMNIEEEIKQLQTWYENGREQSRAVFTQTEAERLRHLVYDAWPDNLKTLGAVKALCHGDFHFNNIFYDTNGRVGIIDFGDVCQADHSKDFINLDDPIILRATLDKYGGDDPAMLNKIALRRAMLQVVKLTAQQAKGETAAAALTVQTIRQNLV